MLYFITIFSFIEFTIITFTIPFLFFAVFMIVGRWSACIFMIVYAEKGFSLKSRLNNPSDNEDVPG